MMDKPVEALQQSFLRTKATDLASFLQVADLKANSSNDTIFADDKGEIAYLHPQFVPRRDNRFDYKKPVDGSDPATDWRGLHALSELPSVVRPPNGWVVNTNDWPYRAAGAVQPEPEALPQIYGHGGRELPRRSTPRSCSRAATAGRSNGCRPPRSIAYQPGFAELIPRCFVPMTAAGADPRRARLAQPIAVLRSWNYRWSADSVAQTAGEPVGRRAVAALHPPPDEDSNLYMARLGRDTTDAQKLARAR